MVLDCYWFENLLLMPNRKFFADVARTLRSEIHTGQFKPYDRLPPERKLAERFSASRGTIRKALILLQTEGLIAIKRSSGTYVSPHDSEHEQSIFKSARPLELMDARFALEPHICRLLVLNARNDDIAGMMDLVDAMEQNIHDAVEFAELDTQFHAKLVSSTGNSLLEWIALQINSVRRNQEWSRMRSLTLEPNIIQEYNVQHRRIVAAIRNRDPELAAARMKEHLNTARLSLTKAAAA